MGAVFDFLGSPAGVELLRILDSFFTILAAILSGAALANAVKVKKAIGNTFERGIVAQIKHLFRRGRYRDTFDSATLEHRPLTIQQQLDGLKTTTEMNWVKTGIRLTDAERRLNRVDPPRRRGDDE